MEITQEIKRLAKDILYAPSIYALRLRQQLSSVSAFELIDSACRYAMERYIGNGFCFISGGKVPDLYSTAYAISLLGLCRRLDWLDALQRRDLVEYFAAHQAADGLYRAENLNTPQAEAGQGWGYMHLLPHILIALDYLDAKPEIPFGFVNQIFQSVSPEDWLEAIFLEDYLEASNFFMNIQVALQYQRDIKKDDRMAVLSGRLNQHVLKEILPRYIGNPDQMSVFERSKKAKTIYHLLPSLCYDELLPQKLAKGVARLTLATQNRVGSYGVCIMSDACEDIDSVYNLAVLLQQATSPGVKRSLEKARLYMPVNQNSDGGFVFRRYTSFCYGGAQVLSSARNQSNMFATWFRVLAYAFADRATEHQINWNFSRVPGYQWHPDVRGAK
jgi:prenyltransferase beta subunit